MSPNARDRASDKRRNDKRQRVLDMRAAQTRRNKQVLGIVAAMVVLIGGFVVLTQVMKQDGSSRPTTAPGAAGQTNSAPRNVVAGCTPAPSTPTDSRTRTKPDKATAAGKTFIATVATNCGVITMELDGTKAPQTVASFLGLARSGYWADSPCHRLTTAASSIFVLQCGDPTGTGNGDPGYSFGVENPPADSKFAPGTLAMARAPDPESNGGQFFIVYKDTVLEDAAGYSIFGKVTSGMDIVDKVAAAGTNPDGGSQGTTPMQPISIVTVTVAEKKA